MIFLNYMVLCENFIAREGKVESGLLESGICITLCVTSEIERRFFLTKVLRVEVYE